MDTNSQPSSFDQELNTKVNELEIQRKLRTGRSVELTLGTILDRVQPRQDAVSNILSKSKTIPKDLRELLWHEICRAADGNLLCTAYRERRKSEQRVIAYTGCCWEMIDQQFPKCPSISIDYAVMERADEIFVFPADFGWSDVGTWGSLHTLAPTDKDGNNVVGNQVKLYETKDCVVHVTEEKRVVVQGLEGYIVAEKGNTLLICKLEEEQRIKEFSAE
jgi:hypothetical protein